LRIIFSDRKASTGGPAIFIDRDGVINSRRPNDYVLDWSQFVFVPGIRAALKQLAALELPIMVISNQAAVGKGLLDQAGLKEITAQMHRQLLLDGVSLTAAYYCIHRSDENCLCRKPKPGLLREAAADFDIDLRQSVLIGDSDTDIQAALAAGCKPVQFGSRLKPSVDSKNSVENLAHSPSAAELFDVVAKCLPALK
jgi:D-glycero-D-manno-heptose 1,7-bisphosphate phosphatase